MNETICNKKNEYRTVKIRAGMIPEYEFLRTNAPDHVIKAQLMYISACEEKGIAIPSNPYGMIEEFGYKVDALEIPTDFDEETHVDVEFDYYDL